MAQEFRQYSSCQGRPPWIERDLMKLLSEEQSQKFDGIVARIILSQPGDHFLDDGLHRIPAILGTSSINDFIHGSRNLQLDRFENGMTIAVYEYNYIIRLKDGAFKFFICVKNWEHVTTDFPDTSNHLPDINSLETTKNLLQSCITNAIQDMDSSNQLLLSQFPNDSQTLSNLVLIANQAISRSQSQQSYGSLESSGAIASNNYVNRMKDVVQPNLSQRLHQADVLQCSCIEEPCALGSPQNNKTFIDSVADQDVSPTQLLEMMVREAQQNYGLPEGDQQKIICAGTTFGEKVPVSSLKSPVPSTGRVGELAAPTFGEKVPVSSLKSQVPSTGRVGELAAPTFGEKVPVSSLKSPVPSTGGVGELAAPTFQDLFVPSDQRRSLAQIQGWCLSDDSSRDSSSSPAFLLPSLRNSYSSSLGNIFLQPTVKDYKKHVQTMPKGNPVFNHLAPPGLMKENWVDTSEKIINDKLFPHHLPDEVIKENCFVNSEVSGKSGYLSHEVMVKGNGFVNSEVSGKSGYLSHEVMVKGNGFVNSEVSGKSGYLSHEVMVKGNGFANSDKNISGKFSLSSNRHNSTENEQSKNSSASLFSDTELEISTLPSNFELGNEQKESITLLEHNSSFPCCFESIESGKIFHNVESNEGGKIYQHVQSNESKVLIQSCDSVTRDGSQFGDNEYVLVKADDCLPTEALNTKCEPYLHAFEKQTSPGADSETLDNSAQTTRTEQGHLADISQSISSDFTLDTQTDSSPTTKPQQQGGGRYGEAAIISSVIDLSSTDDIYLMDGLVIDSFSDSLTSSSDTELTSPFQPYQMSTQVEHDSPETQMAVDFDESLSSDKGTNDNVAGLVTNLNQDFIRSSSFLKSINSTNAEVTAGFAEEQDQTKSQDLLSLNSLTWHIGNGQTNDHASNDVSQNHTNSAQQGYASRKPTTDGIVKLALQNIAATINSCAHMWPHTALLTRESKLEKGPVTLGRSKIETECHLNPVEGTRTDQNTTPSHSRLTTLLKDSRLTTSLKDSPPTTSQKDSPPTTSRKDSPPTTSRKDSPPTTSQKDSPPTTSQKDSPPTTSQKDSPPTTSQKDSPPTTSQKDSPPTTSQKDSPPTTSQKDSPPTTSQKDSPPTTSQKDSPLTTSRKDSPPTTSQKDSPSTSNQPESAHEQVTKELRIILTDNMKRKIKHSPSPCEPLMKKVRIILTDIMKRKIKHSPSPCEPLMKKVRIILTDIMKSNEGLHSNDQPNLSTTSRHCSDVHSSTRQFNNQATTPHIDLTFQETMDENRIGSYRTRSQRKLQKSDQSVVQLPQKNLRVSVIDVGKRDQSILDIQQFPERSPDSRIRLTSSTQHNHQTSKLGGHTGSVEQFTKVRDKNSVRIKQTRLQACPVSENSPGLRTSEMLRQGRRQSRRILTSNIAKMASCESQDSMITSPSLSDHVTTSLISLTATYSTSDWRNIAPVIASSSEPETQEYLLGELTPAVSMCPSAIRSRRLVPSAIESQGLVPSAIESRRLVPSAIESQRSVPSAIESQRLVPSAIESQGLVPSAIESQGLVPSAIESQGLVPSAIESRRLVPSAIESRRLVPSAIESQGLVPSAIESQGLVPSAIESRRLVPSAIRSQGLVPSAIESQGFVPSAIESQGLVPSAIRSQGLVPSAIESQGFVPSAIESQGLVPSAIRSQGLVPSAIESQGFVPSAIESQGFVLPSTETIVANCDNSPIPERLHPNISSLVNYICSGKLL